MPSFIDELFGDGDDPQQYDAGDLQGVWEDSIEKSRFWYDYRDDAQQELFSEFMDQFSRGGTRYGMELWLVKMGIEDFEFDWEGWRTANGY